LLVPTGAQVAEALGHIVPIRFLPDNPLYISISAKETVLRFFKPSAVRRAEFDYVLASKRIKESYVLNKKGKLDKVAGSLRRYALRLDTTTAQIEKARSQNQDVTVLASKVADNLEHQEILLLALASDDKISNLIVLDQAFSSFVNLVSHIENIMPGVKNRYELLKTSNENSQGDATSNITVPTENIFSTPSARPLRIIR